MLIRGRDSFTILEALITIPILAGGLAVLLQMFSIGIVADVDTENSVIALNLAQEKMEEIKGASSYDDIDNFSSGRVNVNSDFPGFKREVNISGDPKRVDVVVYWMDRGREQSVRLTTLLADYDY